MNPEPLITPDAVAERLGVPVTWVYAHQQDLSVIHVGRYLRFTAQAVEDYIDRHRTTSPQATAEALAAQTATRPLATRPLATSRRSVGARRAARTRRKGTDAP